MFIPVNEPVISKEAKGNVIKALDDNWISSSGSFVKQFEDDFAKIYKVKHAITVANGTAALHVALLSLDIGPGDEVIVPAFTMGASWLAVMYTGAKPVFVDCELDTYNIDVNKIEEKINERTKVIMPVHIYGHPCEMDKIMELAKIYNLYVLEDAAEAHGALYNNKLVGTFGDIGCFSFYANKIITTGEGGMIITNNYSLFEKCLKFKDLHHSAKRFIHDGIGFNYRMTNLQAAVGCGELQHLQEYVDKKIWMANLYSSLLDAVPGVITPKTNVCCRSVYWMYAIIIDESKFGINKDFLRIKLKEVGIDTRDFFYSPEDQPVLKDIVVGENYPNTKYLSKNGMYLPSGLAISKQQIEYICEEIKKIQVSR